MPNDNGPPVCPHRLCGRPMLRTHLAGMFECPHRHRPRSVVEVADPDYLARFLPLARLLDDDAPLPNHETKRSTAPWPTQPDRGPLVVHVERTPKGRRGRR